MTHPDLHQPSRITAGIATTLRDAPRAKQRLSRLLRERGGVLRNQSPSEAEVGQMGAMYE